METFFEQLKALINLLFFYPKSTTTSVIFLFIIIVIALYVNQKRDASGKVSFIDMSKTGITGVRLYKIENDSRKDNWLLPLWIPESNLQLKMKILLSKGMYEIKAYWKSESYQNFREDIFKKQPVGKERAYSLSYIGKFEISEEMPVEFMLIASDKNLQIDSPDKELFISDPDNAPLPLTISDSSFKKIANRFEKLKKTKIWELSVIDERIIEYCKNETRNVHRKLDKAIIKNKELESNVDHLIKELKKLQQFRASVLKKMETKKVKENI